MNPKRRKFWVDGGLQGEIVAVILLLVLATLAIAGVSVVKGLGEAATRSSVTYHSIDWTLKAIRGPLVLAWAIAVLAAGLVGLLWSQRLAAPLRVLSAAFERLGEGRFAGSLRVRSTDAHRELINEFSRMESRLHGMLSEERERAGLLSRDLDELAAMREAGSSERERILGLARDARALLGRFQL